MFFNFVTIGNPYYSGEVLYYITLPSLTYNFTGFFSMSLITMVQIRDPDMSIYCCCNAPVYIIINDHLFCGITLFMTVEFYLHKFRTINLSSYFHPLDCILDCRLHNFHEYDNQYRQTFIYQTVDCITFMSTTISIDRLSYFRMQTA